ncbi:MAG TPA: flagellar hook-basal body complex protein FliE [Phycisphaerales bacterium]|nr:flagellar hook-basal body complex protein FliE [Phycisphaerales bacterium]
MSDPVGLIGRMSGVTPPLPPAGPSGAGGASGGEGGLSFKDLMKQEIQRVNDLQTDASQAIEDLATGKRDDLEGVIFATAQADTAFKMLVAVRNRVMDAYDEVKQMRI